jgi:hypothetical protein
MAVLIDGIKIFTPSSIELVPIIVAREAQVASGKEVADIIRRKTGATFGWERIYYDELKKILDILSTEIFHQWTFPHPQYGEAYTIIAKLQGEPRISNWRWLRGQRVWKNVSISILER